MTDRMMPLTNEAKKIGHSEFQISTFVSHEQQIAHAAESIAIQMSLINQKFDLLIEAISGPHNCLANGRPPQSCKGRLSGRPFPLTLAGDLSSN
jgi:hypothetical protein